MTRPAASIIIPVYNRPEELSHVLGQLAVQSRLDFEVVVVDDGSSPPMTPPAAPLPYNLRVVRNKQRGGIGKARNTGIASAGAELLVFVDSDGDIADTRWFEKHLALYPQAVEMARQAGKTGCVLHSEVVGISRNYWGRTDTYSNWFGSAMTRPCMVTDRHVPTHNTSVYREVFDHTGPFDESLEVCEDVEWSFRCLDSGIGLIFIPGAPVGHFDRNGFSGMWNHYYRFGRYALKARSKVKRTPYAWLFPRGPLSGVVLFFPVPMLMTGYVIWQWLRRDFKVLLYLPGLYLANLASYIGICRSLLDKKDL
ncbi:MAG: glycosyltransferase family 2 protein [Candidatus Hydrogenedentes bacterium]|nr:glycosyltransferase family 2 protein [Candidatus Hydrogenedentota bacterium]